MKNLQPGGGAKCILALAALGLMSSTPGLALLPPEAMPSDAIVAPQPVEAAPVETVVPAEEATERAP